MRVESFGHVQSFDSLRPGAFFRCLRGDHFFGLCITDGERKSALIFDKGPHGNPWIAIGGIPHDTMLAYDDALLRVDHDSVSANSIIANGDVISCNGAFYMRAFESAGWNRTVDLDSGKVATLPDDCAFATYARWSVGVVVGETFHTLFSFR